jgi:hypothetical protein
MLRGNCLLKHVIGRETEGRIEDKEEYNNWMTLTL